jgi:hypothetical protein
MDLLAQTLEDQCPQTLLGLHDLGLDHFVLLDFESGADGGNGNVVTSSEPSSKSRTTEQRLNLDTLFMEWVELGYVTVIFVMKV